MDNTFNPQILVEKLAKLNSSQASIETLSHWCIFHMNKAKLVVETWEKQFHRSPREQRLAFLYLANDILQNSRRKGSEFVGEFWKVLPDALLEVIDNGDETGRNASLRLISIWEERKVFGPRPHSLKEEFLGKQLEKKHVGSKQSIGAIPDKIVSGYTALRNLEMDEDHMFRQCNSAMASIGKFENESSGNMQHPKELQGDLVILKDSVRQLVSIESLRSNLLTLLREATSEQEQKLEHVRNQIQTARTKIEQADTMLNGCHDPSFATGNREQFAFSLYSRQISGTETDESRKAAAAAVAEELTSSSSSAQVLSFVLSSLARKEEMMGCSPDKRAKLDGDQPYIPTDSPIFQHLEQLQSAASVAGDPPPPPSSPLRPPPPPLSQYVPLNYISQRQQPQLGDYTFAMSATSSSCQAHPHPGDSNLYSLPSSIPTARQ